MKHKLFSAVRLMLVPFKLALLIVPAVALMVYVNYNVDCSGLFQGDLTNRTIVELLLAGSNVSDFSQMDQRAVLELYAALLPDEQLPQTLALGSSRVMQLTRGIMGQSFYNCGMTGADYRDVMNEIYSFAKYDKLPKRVILNLDPWFFRGDADGLEARADADLYAEFCSVALGYDTSYEPPEETEAYRLADRLVQRFTKGETQLPYLNITSATLSALFEPAYFQGNVKYYQARKKSAQATTEDGDIIPYAAASGTRLTENADEIKLADGTIWYSAEFRSASQEEVLAAALAQAGTFLRMEGYTTLDSGQCALLEDFVSYLERSGVEVYFMLSPYHPFFYEYEQIYNLDQHAGFYEIEPYVRAFAEKRNIPVIGSYDPAVLGLTDEDFFDGLHVRESGIRKFFGGLSADGEVLAGSVVDSKAIYLDENGALAVKADETDTAGAETDDAASAQSDDANGKEKAA